jgi:ketosteroid isomerase-like protein
MNRILSAVLFTAVVLVLCARTMSHPASDEETVKNLEMESAKHPGFSDADIAFQKSIMSDKVTFVDPVGHVFEQSPAEFEKVVKEMRAANPNGKTTVEVSDIKVRVSGDTATALIHGTYTASGMKDPSQNVPSTKYIGFDTWQKQAGKWKQLGGAAVSTTAIPPEAYKSAAPGSTN